MSGLLEGKICVVTGASRGIGKAIAQLFAQEGAIVYAISTKARDTESWCNLDSKYATIKPMSLDISNEGDIQAKVLKIKGESRHIDVLVNNAGVEFNELIGMISQEHMEKMFSVNVFGLINMLQYCSRLMHKKGGSIINISSLVGIRGNSGQLVYSATKGAVIALTRSAAKELAAKNIRVNSIAPGLTHTDMMNVADIGKLQNRIDNICMKRLAEPIDIAKACLFLASELSEYISGQVISVDGCTII